MSPDLFSGSARSRLDGRAVVIQRLSRLTITFFSPPRQEYPRSRRIRVCRTQRKRGSRVAELEHPSAQVDMKEVVKTNEADEKEVEDGR